MTDQPSAWKTIREAALELGLSELTIRRRIKDGRLAHRLERGKYFVNFDVPVPRRSGVPPRPAPSAEAMVVERGQVMDAPNGVQYVLPELSRLAQEAGRSRTLEEQVRRLEERQEALQHDLVTLATRNGWLESQLKEREKDVLLLTDSARKRGWRRLLGRNE